MDGLIKIFEDLKAIGISSQQEELILKEIAVCKQIRKYPIDDLNEPFADLYSYNDLQYIAQFILKHNNAITSLQTLDDLLQKDKQREKDGFPRRIRIGKFIKPSKDNKEQIVVVPTTTEPKFYHDNSITEEETTGGAGEGEEGDVIAEKQAQPEEGEGENQGAGQGSGGNHDISSDAFDLGKVLTEKFELPNLKVKGKKRSFSKYTYDLTDKNRGFGQLLDKKATLKKIIETNILLGKINPNEPFNPQEFAVNPKDSIYRIMSREKDFESQAVVFFIRDYSGSMQGKPTEAVVTQHLFIYSWLMFQYKNNVQARFILHDTEAKEVPDFYTYYKSAVAGGTSVYPSYELVNNIVLKEQLARENNIYVFHGTDGDDWEEHGEKAIEALKVMIGYANRTGITVAKNSWSGGNQTTVEKYLENSNLLKDKPSLIRLDSFSAMDASEARLIEGIKKLIS